jgi:hypothetical protein
MLYTVLMNTSQACPPTTRPFMEVFVGTQMFAEYVQRQMGQ